MASIRARPRGDVVLHPDAGFVLCTLCAGAGSNEPRSWAVPGTQSTIPTARASKAQGGRCCFQHQPRMDGPTVGDNGVMTIDGCPPPPAAHAVRADAPPKDNRAVREELPDLLVVSHPQVEDDSKPTCVDHAFAQGGSGFGQ